MRIAEINRMMSESKDPIKTKRAYDFFVKEKGYSAKAALGIIGNLMQESTPDLDTGAIGFDGTGSYGVAQWLGARQDKLKEIRPNDYQTLDGQLEFIDWELNNTEKRAAKKLKEAKTVDEATRNFSKYYERPHKDYAHNEKRVNYANKVAKQVGVDVNLQNDLALWDKAFEEDQVVATTAQPDLATPPIVAAQNQIAPQAPQAKGELAFMEALRKQDELLTKEREQKFIDALSQRQQSDRARYQEQKQLAQALNREQSGRQPDLYNYIQENDGNIL